MQQALSDIYKKKKTQQTQGYGQQNQDYGEGRPPWAIPEGTPYNWQGGLGENAVSGTGVAPTWGSFPLQNNPAFQTNVSPPAGGFNGFKPSPVSSALTGWLDTQTSFQNMPTSWDWEGGEASPYGIKTPWLGYQWHYDDQGVIVPNDPNNPLAPWNMQGSTQTYEDWYGQQQPSSLFNKEVK